MAEFNATRDEAIAKAASLESKRKCLAWLVADDVDAELGRALFENDALCAELASLKGRFIEMEKQLMIERRQKVAAQQALTEAKMARVGRNATEKVAVASARKEAVKEVKQRWKATECEWVKVFREKSIQQAISFGIRFWRSALYLIRQKHLRIDLSGINFKLEGNDKPDSDDFSVEDSSSGSTAISDSPDSSLARVKDANVVDVNSL